MTCEKDAIGCSHASQPEHAKESLPNGRITPGATALTIKVAEMAVALNIAKREWTVFVRPDRNSRS